MDPASKVYVPSGPSSERALSQGNTRGTPRVVPTEPPMPKRTTGRYERTRVGGEEVAAFIPHPLPPAKPPLALHAALTERVRVAEQALIRLELAGEMVPSLDWFIYAFVRKEAVISSQIEGTQATLIDLLEYEAEQASRVAGDDVHEVCNYLDAIKYAREQIKSARGLPLSMRLLN